MLELKALGECKLWLAGLALDLPPKRLALVVYLALEGGALEGQKKGVRREVLAELLWTDSHPEAARRNLRQELHRLKATALAGLLELTPEAVMLRGPLECDVLQFEREQGDPQAALALYRGPLLEGLDVPGASGFDEWLENRRTELHTVWLRLKRARVAQLEAGGHLREALLELTPLLETPDEALHREAIRLHALLGERDLALEHYLVLKTLLERELGVLPDAQTQALFERLRGLPSSPIFLQAPHGSLSRPPLIGREALLDTLEHTLSEKGGLVLLSGEPGVGKSAVLEALTHRWGAVLTLRGREDGEHTPFLPLFVALREHLSALGTLKGVWRREVARLIPELEPDLHPKLQAGRAAPEGRAHFLEALNHALERVLSGALLVLEDLHLFDPSSLEVLSLWSQGTGRATGRAIASVRPEEGRANPALERWTGALERRGRLTCLALPALTETETLRLVRALSPSGRGGTLFSRRLFETTEGNPLFMLETLKGLLESGELREEGGEWHTRFDDATQDYGELPLPHSVQAALLTRLERLGEALRRLLESTALLGETFSWSELEGATPLSEWQALEALETAVGAGFLTEQSGRYRFGHALMRRTLIKGLRPERRGLLHRKLSQTLERLKVPAARLAPHLEGCGEYKRAAQVRLEAARDAVQVYAHGEALEHFGKALENGLGAQEAFEVQLERAQVYRILDHKPGWEGALRAAESLSSAAKQHHLLELWWAELDFYSGRYAQVLERTEALWSRLDLSAEQRGWAGLWAGNVLSRTSRLEEAMGWYERALESVTQGLLGSDARARLGTDARARLELRGRLLNAWAFASCEAGLLELGQQKVALALEAFGAAQFRKGLAMAHNTAGSLEYACEHDEATAEHYRETYRISLEIGDLPSQRLALTSLSAVYLVLERFDDALEATNQGLELLEHAPDAYAESLFLERLFLIQQGRGRLEQALESLNRSIEIADREGFTVRSLDGRLQKLEFLHEHSGPNGEIAALTSYLRAHLPSVSESLRKSLEPRLAALELDQTLEGNTLVTPL